MFSEKKRIRRSVRGVMLCSIPYIACFVAMILLLITMWMDLGITIRHISIKTVITIAMLIIVHCILIEIIHIIRYINILKILLDEDTYTIGGKISLDRFINIWNIQVVPMIDNNVKWSKKYGHPRSIMYSSDSLLVSDYTGIVRRNGNGSYIIYKNSNPVITIDNLLYWVSYPDYRAIQDLEYISLDEVVSNIEFEAYNKRIQNGECLRRYDDVR